MPDELTELTEDQRLAAAERELAELRGRLAISEEPIPDPIAVPNNEPVGYGGIKIDGEAIGYDGTLDPSNAGSGTDGSGTLVALSIDGQPGEGTVEFGTLQVLDLA